MKISHKELEACRLSPRIWLAQRSAQENSGSQPRFSYNQALNYAIAELHKSNNITQSVNKLNSYLEKFKDEKRKELIRIRLISYADWLETAGVIPVDSNVTVNFPSSGEWHLGGWVSRVDIISTGYSAVLFGAIEAGWRGQLRMPLIQLAVAEKYGRPTSEIRVGFQDLEDNRMVDFRFPKANIDAAVAEFMKLGDQVRKLNPALFA